MDIRKLQNDIRKFKKPYTHHRFASRRDYNHRKTLGAGPTEITPNLYSITEILNQGNAPKCTAYAAAAIRESMTTIKYDPEKQWLAELAFMGVKDASGVELKTQLAVGVKTGFYRQGSNNPDDKANAYLFVKKQRDLDWFDEVRGCINQLFLKYNKIIPLTIGMNWYANWDFAPDGIIPNEAKNLLGGHDVKVAGYQTFAKDRQDYILLQNSWGPTYGDNGLFRVSRDVFNKWFDVYGAGYWIDDPDVKIQNYGLLSALLQNLVALYQSLISKLG